MKVTELRKFVNPEIALREPNDAKVRDYAERMGAGVKFPPVIIGKWPKSDKYGDTGIVDGLHRLMAAAEAKIPELDHVFKDFGSLQDMLTFMYTANMAHGLAPTEGQRNARIVLIKKIDPTLTLEKIAEQFKLGKSSIDRILKGQQREGRGGVQTGSKRSKAHQDLKPTKPKAFYTMLDKLNVTLSDVRSIAEIVTYATPEGKSGIEMNIELRDTVKAAAKNLSLLCESIENAKTK